MQGEVLCKIVQGKADVLLVVTRLLSKFESAECSREVDEVVQRLNTFRGTFGFDKSGKRGPKKRSTFLNCPLVWDTVGASFGLTG